MKTVILSGFCEFSYAREAMRYGAVDYLNKPVNLREVEALLERLRADFIEEKRVQEWCAITGSKGCYYRL